MDTIGYRRADPLQSDRGPPPGFGVPGVEQRHDRDACGSSFGTELLVATATEHHRRLLGMQIEAADREIDALVYDLTPEEIVVVEAAVGPAKR